MLERDGQSCCVVEVIRVRECVAESGRLLICDPDSERVCERIQLSVSVELRIPEQGCERVGSRECDCIFPSEPCGSSDDCDDFY